MVDMAHVHRADAIIILTRLEPDGVPREMPERAGRERFELDDFGLQRPGK